MESSAEHKPRSSRLESTCATPVPCECCGQLTVTMVRHWTGFIVPACDLKCSDLIPVRPVLGSFRRVT